MYGYESLTYCLSEMRLPVCVCVCVWVTVHVLVGAVCFVVSVQVHVCSCQHLITVAVLGCDFV